MILENEKERIAFDFIVQVASEAFSRAGCNDLSKDFVSLYADEKVLSNDTDGMIVPRNIIYDFDVLEWLKGRSSKKDKYKNKHERS